MAKKDLFHRLSHNEQLEEILETKTFSLDCKNLLLSILYKLETSYNDYETVKRMVDTKKQMIEDILNIIAECNEIILVDPNSAKMREFKEENIKFRIDKQEKIIETEPNENSLLNAIYNLPVEKKVYLDEEHSAIRNSLPFILETGRNINRAEIIRDFDAWSWNTLFSEIPSIECNLIYQNLQILLGKEFLESWMKLENTKNSLEILSNELEKMLEKKDAEEFLNLIFRLSIIIYCKNNEKEAMRLRDELDWNNEELKRLNDTIGLVEEITEIKTKAIAEIDRIDRILNDKEAFEKELIKVNEKQEDTRMLMPDDFENKLQRKKKKMEKKIKDADNMLLVKQYMQRKSQIIKDSELFKAIDESEKKEEYILKLQEYFIKGIKAQIMAEEDKNKIIDLVYIIRYYNFIPYSNDKYIKDVEELKDSIDEIEELLANKLIAQKIVNRLSNNIEFDKNIIKKIFNMRMINLENINAEFANDYEVIFYDVETIEEKFDIDCEEVTILKYDRKIKLFI